jgi:hypothetical protein
MIKTIRLGVLASFAAIIVASAPAAAQQPQPQRKPNILVIMGDDVGWFNIGAYHRGTHPEPCGGLWRRGGFERVR